LNPAVDEGVRLGARGGFGSSGRLVIGGSYGIISSRLIVVIMFDRRGGHKIEDRYLELLIGAESRNTLTAREKGHFISRL
jgi:hypothetical protein